MSSPTWTPDALALEARGHAGTGWRLVEAQHRVSTLTLVDSLDEQAVLEAALEATKPPVPPECRHLHDLLFTPFRYRPYPEASRFRRAGLTPGVFYASETTETAIAETVFYRLLFYAESPATRPPEGAGEYTAFACSLATARALDLREPPLSRDEARWTDPIDYGPCQDLADAARRAELEILRYRSVRDPDGGANLAVLTCRAFAVPEPTSRQTWRIRVGPFGGQALCEHPRAALEFPYADFAHDPHLPDAL